MMGARDRILSIAQEATPLTLHCRCGQKMTLAANLAGSRGRCPACDRWLRAPSSRIGGQGESTHPMKDVKVAMMEPNFAPTGSGYYSAQLHTFVLGIFHMFIWGGFLTLVGKPTGAFLTALGFSPETPQWMAVLWVLAAAAGGTACSLPVAATYRRITGRSYGDDRKGYAEAGGFDIVRWTPLTVYAILFLILLKFGSRMPPGRSPWLILPIAVSLSLLASWLLARRVLRARFGTSRRNP